MHEPELLTRQHQALRVFRQTTVEAIQAMPREVGRPAEELALAAM